MNFDINKTGHGKIITIHFQVFGLHGIVSKSLGIYGRNQTIAVLKVWNVDTLVLLSISISESWN